ncbi:Serine/threonine protein phosphatase 2A 57 kDa regulatory subunit B beta isoform [Striga hermonthica]|uniref:Serine/threonine protein phosphatase 2A 57 kDa regulatory subunit B beta isoform n=1 Tax=Striga hermonthica TaxID=68872 RepID=A0A9N7NYZ3_STRHE|nr:Serine/threonine protein phosphatase 2A 57 kDa regulatory subunit B beta isoform [Striga hermonthica]
MGAHKNSSKVSPKPKSTTLKFLLDLDSKHNCNGNPERQEILSVISYCTYYIFTFTDPLESPFHQNQKRDKLTKLLYIIKSLKKPLPDQILSPLFCMIWKNLFRTLPPPNSPAAACFFPEDDDLTYSPTPAWPHLYLVYDILLVLLTELEEKTLSKYINGSFIHNMLALFESEDPRVRQVLKTAYHKMYSRLHVSRPCMRNAMGEIFLDYIYEAERKHYGIGDLLEILGTIINGFSVPLKEEHRVFLMRVLVPLHRPKEMHAYHKQLAYCITKCSNSWNSQVAERALYVWNNERFVKMVSEAIDDVFPLIVEGIERNLKGHWSRSVGYFSTFMRLQFILAGACTCKDDHLFQMGCF